MLRTLEDLLLTGESCVNPSNADTPLAAGTVCGGLDGQGHIGYAAQSGLASFGPDVFTAERFSAVTTPQGYSVVSGGGPTALYCPVHVPLGQGGRNGRPGQGFFSGNGGAGGSSGCGASGGNGGNGGNGFSRTGRGGNGGNGGNAACAPERWANGTWLTAAGGPTMPTNTPPCNGAGGNGGNGGSGGNGFGRFSGGNGGNGANGTPGHPGRNGTKGI